MNFFYQIYYGIINLISSPTRAVDGLVESHPTRRAFILGVPAFIIGIAAVATWIGANMVGVEGRIRTYKAEAERAEEETTQIRQMLRFRNTQGEDAPVPEYVKQNIDEEYVDCSIEDLEEKRVKYLHEWEIYLHKLIEMDPTQDEWKLQLAKVAAEQKRTALVEVLLDDLAPIDRPGNREAQYVRGQRYFQLKLFSVAQRHFEQALHSDADFVNARVYLIACLVNTQQFAQAKEHFKLVFESNLTKHIELLDLGLRIYRRTDGVNGEKAILNQAITILREQVIRNTQSQQHWRQLLACYSSLGRFKDAEELILKLRQMDNISPKDTEDHRVRLGEIYARWAISVGKGSGQYDKELNLELLRKSYIEFPENPNALRYISQIALSEDADAAKRAKELYDPMTDNDPPSGVHIELSNFYLRGMENARIAKDQKGIEKFRDLAVKELTSAHEKDENNNQVRNNLAFLLIQQGDGRLNDALELSEKAVMNLVRAGRPVGQMSEFFDTLGTIEMTKAYSPARTEPTNSRKFFLRAITSFNRAKIGRPDNLGIVRSLVRCHKAVGDQAGAEKLEKRLKLLEEKLKNKNNK